MRERMGAGSALITVCAFALAVAAPAFATGGQDCRYAARIAIGEVVSGVASGTTPRCYRFDVEAPGFYRLYTAGQVDTVGSLLDAGFNQIAGDDDGGHGLNFLIGRELGRGAHYVVARGYGSGSSGPFTLRVEGPVGAAGAGTGSACGNALPLTPGTPVSCAVGGAEPSVFRFQVPAAGSYQIATYGSLDTVGALLDAGCNAIEEDDDSGWGYNFYIESSLPAGTYHVAVRGYDEDEEGETTLTVRREITRDEGCDAATPVAPGREWSGSLQGTTELYFTFEVPVPGFYRIFTTGDEDTVGKLLDGFRHRIAENDDGGGNRNFLIERNLVPGTYYVSFQGYSETDTGPVSFWIEAYDVQIDR